MRKVKNPYYRLDIPMFMPTLVTELAFDGKVVYIALPALYFAYYDLKSQYINYTPTINELSKKIKLPLKKCKESWKILKKYKLIDKIDNYIEFLNNLTKYEVEGLPPLYCLSDDPTSREMEGS